MTKTPTPAGFAASTTQATYRLWEWRGRAVKSFKNTAAGASAVSRPAHIDASSVSAGVEFYTFPLGQIHSLGEAVESWKTPRRSGYLAIG